ncbi:unnamed protein product [Prunus armeniaca]
MESFSSIVSLTYARRRQASSPLQTSCSTKHELNGVFFEHCVPDIRSQATSLISIADKLLHEARTQWSIFRVLCLRHMLAGDKPHLHCRQATPRVQTSWSLFKRHVPDIRTQATSLTSIVGKLLHEYKLNGVSFKCCISRYTLTRYNEN